MKILCLSDTHGYLPDLDLGGIDLVLHCGDMTYKHKLDYAGQLQQFEDEFCPWVRRIYDEGVDFFFCFGNHETFAEKLKINKTYNDVTTRSLLMAGYHEISHGLVLTGLEYTPRFYDWAFNVDDTKEGMGFYTELISVNTNILVSHGPPYRILDRTYYGDRVGSKELLNKIHMLKNLRLNCFGHIHSGFGLYREAEKTFVNCSIMDERYLPINKSLCVELQR